MFLIQGKRFIYIVVGILISVFTFSITNINNVKTSETVSLPVSGKTIIIDAGHGTPDEGAESLSGVTEAAINLKIALKVQNLLEQSGSVVILTRSDENEIYNEDSSTIRQKKVSDAKNRVKIGNDSSADIFVSIHLNKIAEQQYDGWQTFYKKGNEQGKLLAQSIQNNLNVAIDNSNDRIPKTISDIYIIEHVEIPTTIVECGFLSNKDDEKKLTNDDYQNKLAWGIYNGIIDYFYK